jgi:hypothetical protein
LRSTYAAFATCSALALGVIVAPQASAAGVVSITPPADRVLYSDCYDYAYGYSVSPPSNDWEVDVEITDPFGAAESSNYIYDAEPTVGTETIYLCGDGIDRPGTYTITATMTWYDAAYNAHAEPPVTVQFHLGKPATTTVLTVSDRRPDFNEKVIFRTVSSVQARIGFSPLEYERVRLEAFLRGAWQRIGSKKTNGDGRARFRYRWNTHRPRVKVRAVTVGTPANNLSASSALVIRVR